MVRPTGGERGQRAKTHGYPHARKKWRRVDLVYAMMALLSLCYSLGQLGMLARSFQDDTTKNSPWLSRDAFSKSPPKVVVEDHPKADTDGIERHDFTPRGKARVLMGVFCRSEDIEYQEMFRSLFSLHPAVCSLGSYERDLLQKSASTCEFIYTFVMGGREDVNAPTEMLDQDNHGPLVLEKVEDQLVLNIKENMNDGKSQTWFYFASTVMSDEYLGFDYVGKMDTDSLVYIDQYFRFADSYLHPSPYNQRTMAGILSNKSEWHRTSDETSKDKSLTKERFFKKYYPGRGSGDFLHLYPMGRFTAHLSIFRAPESFY